MTAKVGAYVRGLSYEKFAAVFPYPDRALHSTGALLAGKLGQDSTRQDNNMRLTMWQASLGSDDLFVKYSSFVTRGRTGVH